MKQLVSTFCAINQRGKIRGLSEKSEYERPARPADAAVFERLASLSRGKCGEICHFRSLTFLAEIC